MEQEEKSITCPYCWQTISILLDLSAESQEFVEDCQVCCQPIHFQYTVVDEALSDFSYERAQ